MLLRCSRTIAPLRMMFGQPICASFSRRQGAHGIKVCWCALTGVFRCFVLPLSFPVPPPHTHFFCRFIHVVEKQSGDDVIVVFLQLCQLQCAVQRQTLMIQQLLPLLLQLQSLCTQPAPTQTHRYAVVTHTPTKPMHAVKNEMQYCTHSPCYTGQAVAWTAHTSAMWCCLTGPGILAST